MTTISMKWSEMNDDDFATDEISTGLVQVEGEYKTSTAYEGPVKVITRTKICKRVDRKSGLALGRKERMVQNCGNYKGSYSCEVDKEVFFELPRSLRKLEDEDEPAEATGPGLQTLWRDAVKEKFNQLKALDTEAGISLVTQAAEEEAVSAPAVTTMPGRMGMRPTRDDCVVRVTNLSEETTEDDLGNLFGKIGKVDRIFLARDKETHKSKGYAFITYIDRHTAEEAIRKLDRHGHDSLLLRVEWAKPSVKSRD